MEEIRKSQQSTKILKILLIFCVVFVVLCSTVLIVKYKFTITSVEVQGNEHYTDEEITNMVACATMLFINKLATIAIKAPIENQNTRKPTDIISIIKNIPANISQTCHIFASYSCLC